MHHSPRLTSWRIFRQNTKRHDDDAAQRTTGLKRLKQHLRRFYVRFAPSSPKRRSSCAQCDTDCYSLVSPIMANSYTTRSSGLRSRTTPDIPGGENIRDRKPLCLVCWRYHSRFQGCSGAPLPFIELENGEQSPDVGPKKTGLDRPRSPATMANLAGSRSLGEVKLMAHGDSRQLGLTSGNNNTACAVAYWNARCLEQGYDEDVSVCQTCARVAIFSDAEMEEWNDVVGRLAPRDHEGTSYLDASALPQYAFTLPFRDVLFRNYHQLHTFESLLSLMHRDDMIEDDDMEPSVHEGHARGQPERSSDAPVMSESAVISMTEFEALPSWSDVEDEITDDNEEAIGSLSMHSIPKGFTLGESVKNRQKIDYSNGAFDALLDWSGVGLDGRDSPIGALDVHQRHLPDFPSDISQELEYHTVAFGYGAESETETRQDLFSVLEPPRCIGASEQMHARPLLSDGEFDVLPGWSDVEDESQGYMLSVVSAHLRRRGRGQRHRGARMPVAA